MPDSGKRYVEVESCRDCPDYMGMTTNNEYWCPAIVRLFKLKKATEAEIELDTLHPDCPLPKFPDQAEAVVEALEEVQREIIKERKKSVKKESNHCGDKYQQQMGYTNALHLAGKIVNTAIESAKHPTNQEGKE